MTDGGTLPGVCHLPEPRFEPNDDRLGRLWRPTGGMRLVEEPPPGLDPDSGPWLVPADGTTWEAVFPPRGLGLARQFAKLEPFQMARVTDFASRWGFLADPLALAPASPEWGEPWHRWFVQVTQVRALLDVYDAASMLRTAEDERARGTVMEVLRPQAGGARILPRNVELARLGFNLMLFGPEEVVPEGLDLIRPSRQALARVGMRVVSLFIRRWARGQIDLDLSPPPAPRLRATFSRLGGAVYLALAEEVAGGRAARRRCQRCGKPIDYKRSTKRFCGDNCKHIFARWMAREAAP